MNLPPVNPAHRTPLTCPRCYSNRIVRYGTLPPKHQTTQRFTCAWFDERDFYEFFPSQAACRRGCSVCL